MALFHFSSMENSTLNIYHCSIILFVNFYRSRLKSKKNNRIYIYINIIAKCEKLSSSS